MESFYTLVFLVLLVGIVGLEGVVKAGSRESGGGGATKPEAFKKFRNNYLLVYSLMMGAGAAPGPGRRRRRAARGPPPPPPAPSFPPFASPGTPAAVTLSDVVDPEIPSRSPSSTAGH